MKDCPGFKAALEDQKQEIIKKIKVKYPVCSKCLSWSHKVEDCKWKTKCLKCNKVHINDMCTLKKSGTFFVVIHNLRFHTKTNWFWKLSFLFWGKRVTNMVSIINMKIT